MMLTLRQKLRDKQINMNVVDYKAHDLFMFLKVINESTILVNISAIVNLRILNR